MPRPWWFLSMLLIPWSLSAAPAASLSSLEGEVRLVRAGTLIPSEKLTEGFVVEPFDTVITGVTGRTDIRFAPATGLSGTLRLDPETTLYLEFSPRLEDQTVGVEVLAGAVSTRIAATTGSSALEIRTDRGTFSGGGPGFRVCTTSLGDTLVTVTSGKVQCRVSNRTVFIEPGTAVESGNGDLGLRTLSASGSTLDSFEQAWVLQRDRVIRDQTAVLFRETSRRYQLQVAALQRAWDRRQRESQDSSADTATSHLRSAAGLVERTLFQVRTFRKFIDDGVLSSALELSRGYSARDFLRQVAQDETVWVPRLQVARGWYRDLADRNGGVFPRSSAGADVRFDSPFFY